ncbi:MAG: FAD/NAD(P)-binding protein [Burkholderiales bacterium]
MSIVTIIGGGFSGALTALHLLRLSTRALGVRVIDRSGRFGPGLPYQTRDPMHLLNVPAGNMSAWPDRPDHFVEYLRGADRSAGSGDFVPRGIYGDYLESLVQAAQHEFGERLSLIPAEVVATVPGEDDRNHVIRLRDGRELVSDAVVFAFGHAPPRRLELTGGGAGGPTPVLVEDPWNAAAIERLETARHVLLIGTGLTALDICLSLLARNGTVSIDAWSRHGLLPLPHRSPVAHARPDDAGARLLAGPPTVREYMHRLRAEVRRARLGGNDWRDVVAGLRTWTPALWKRLPSSERARFLRHAQRYWDVHRHRCAPRAWTMLEDALAAGRVAFSAARILDMAAEGSRWAVRYAPLHGDGTLRRGFDAVVNCTGPDVDLDRSGNPLVVSLLEAGLMSADPCRLGVAADEHYRPLRRSGGQSRTWFHVGPGLRASEWEAIAVPELRNHARAVAHEVLTALGSGSRRS